MTKQTLSILALLLLVSVQVGAEVVVESLSVSQPSLFTREDRTLLFTAKVDMSKGERPDHLILYQTNDTNKTFEHRWKMQDNGFMGDKKVGDGIYTRKVEFKEKNPGFIYFAVGRNAEPRTSGSLTQVFPDTLKVSIKVIQRPTFFQLLGRLWNRLTNKTKPSS